METFSHSVLKLLICRLVYTSFFCNYLFRLTFSCLFYICTWMFNSCLFCLSKAWWMSSYHFFDELNCKYHFLIVTGHSCIFMCESIGIVRILHTFTYLQTLETVIVKSLVIWLFLCMSWERRFDLVIWFDPIEKIL